MKFQTETMAGRVLDEHVLFVHGATAPTDAEWQRVMDLFQSVDPAKARTLVWTEGGAPNAAQRAKLAKWAGDAKPRIAVLTGSAVARAAGVAISWFNPSLRIFAPHETGLALDHIAVPADRRAQLLSTLDELKKALSITPRDRGRTAT